MLVSLCHHSSPRTRTPASHKGASSAPAVALGPSTRRFQPARFLPWRECWARSRRPI